MKKIIFGKDKKPPKPPTAKGKSKSKSKSKAAAVLPSLFTAEEPMLLAIIQPFNIKDEREYLKEILNLENYNDIRIHLTHFGNLFPNIILKKPKNPKDPLIEEKYDGPKYKQVINLIISKYKDIRIIKYFIRLFLNQYALTLEDFYNKFVNDPKIKIKINKIKNDDKTIEQKPVKISKKLQGFVYEQPVPEEFKKCIALYMSVPWLSEKVEKVYISKADTDIEELKLKFTNPFVYEGKEWFRVNKKYYELQCSKFNKIQKGDILNFNDKKTGNLFKNFILGYGIIEPGKTVKKNEVSKIIIQNEDVFKKEQEFIKQYNKTDEQKITDMLQEPLKPDSEKLAIDILTQYMKIKRKINKQYVGPKGNTIDTTEDETVKIADIQFIKDIIDKINDSSKNLQEFITKLGELVIYIIPEVDNITFGLFKTNIEMNLYTPEKLLSLTQKDKMPEIFTDEFIPSDKREKIRGIINSALESTLKEFKEDFIDTLYVIRNPFTYYKKRNTFRKPNDRFRNEYLPEDWRLKCENVYNIYDKKRKIDKKKIDKIPINALGFYINYIDPEDNKTYCLNIYEIGSRIENNDITNPHTNKPLPIDFVEKIKRLNKSKKKEEIIIEEEIPTDKIHIGHLAPGLLEIIRNDINRLIELKTSVKNIDSGPQEDGYNERMSYLNDEVEEIFNSDGYSFGNEDYFEDDDIITIDGHHGKDDEEHEEEDKEHGEHDKDDEEEDKDDEHDKDDEEDKEYDEEHDEEYEENNNKSEYDGIDIQDDDDYTIDDTDDDSVIEMSDFEYDLDLEIPETCKYCSNEITDKKYKSILWNGKGVDGVAFCSIKCIENFDWKKHKCKIKKKKN